MHKMTMNLVAVGLTAASLALVPGGTSAQTPAAGNDVVAEAMTSETRAVQLYVVNNNFLDVNVYALRGGSRFRLGTVRSQTGELLKVPTWVTRGGLEVHLQASLIGASQDVTSEAVQINPGDVVEWRIETSPNLSSLSVWST